MGDAVDDNNTVRVPDLVERPVSAAASFGWAGHGAPEWRPHFSGVLRRRAEPGPEGHYEPASLGVARTRLAALITALSDASRMLESMPTPQSLRPPATSTSM
jgi:hypothetical protein